MMQKPSATQSNAGFVHLHVHSAYSLLKGSIKIQKLAELAKADRQPALALTDTDNMFGALEFSDKIAGYGIQPIIGCELAVDFGDQDPSARNALAAGPARIVLLAARERGYRSLMRLNSRAFLETPIHQAPHIKFEWLQGDVEDLIALTGGPEGPISLAIHADQAALAASRCDRLAGLFGDRLYIELQRHGIEKERRLVGMDRQRDRTLRPSGQGDQVFDVPLQPFKLDVRGLMNGGLQERPRVQPHQAAIAAFARCQQHDPGRPRGKRIARARVLIAE